MNPNSSIFHTSSHFLVSDSVPALSQSSVPTLILKFLVAKTQLSDHRQLYLSSDEKVQWLPDRPKSQTELDTQVSYFPGLDKLPFLSLSSKVEMKGLTYHRDIVRIK